MATQNSINLLAGSGITLTPSGSGLTIASSGGGSLMAFQSSQTNGVANVSGNGALYTLVGAGNWANTVDTTSGAWDSATTVFTAPAAGTYVFGFYLVLTGLTAANSGFAYINGGTGTQQNQFFIPAAPTGGLFSVFYTTVITVAMSGTVSFGVQINGQGADTVGLGGTLDDGQGSVIYGYQIG